MNKVLIVEDDLQLRELYADVLKDADFMVEIASNGQQALAKVISFIPDVIVLDLVIPGITGFELLRKIRTNEATKNMKIIVLTNVYPDKASLLEKGANSVLLKVECTPDQLIQKVREVLSPQNPTEK